MEGGDDTWNTAGEDGADVGAYPEGYTYDAAYYQEGYDASYQQEGYGAYYSQQDAGQEGSGAYQYQYSYDPSAVSQGQDYSYSLTGEEYEADQQYTTETPETWSYSPEERQQVYLDQLAMEQTAGYYYDEQGNFINGYGQESPTNVFNQETYWDSGLNSTNSPYYEDESAPEAGKGIPQDETDADESKSGSIDSATTKNIERKPPQKTIKQDTSGRAASPARKKKTKKERIAERQALLEKEEEERLNAQDATEAADISNNVPGNSIAADSKKSKTLTKKKTGIVGRERAKFQIKLRIIKAIKQTRMPVQLRILPTLRKHLTPMDKYFEGKSVECVLSDIFWASMKGDIGRIKYLVEIEGENPTDSTLDPWNLHQTPLHWAAKGGSVPVLSYLLAAGASPRSLDENGSLPLHLSCWAGHIDASLVLLRASDVKDLYVQDYDGAMCPLDWVNVRGHRKLLKAIEKYQDSLWLPKFVDDLIRGIVRYKIKLFKEPLKKPLKANVEAKPDSDSATATVSTIATTANPTDTSVENPATDSSNITTDSQPQNVTVEAS